MHDSREDISPGMKCIKYLILAFNAIFVMTGILMIAVGTTIHSIYYNFDEFLETKFFSPASLLIVVGAFIFFIALFGLVGAAKESTCIITIYSLLLAFIFILEISAGIAAFALQGEIEGTLRENMLDGLHNYNESEDIRLTIDTVQSTLQCCGVDNQEDWLGILQPVGSLDNSSILLPNSCCSRIIDGECAEDGVNTRGCLPALNFLVNQSVILLGGAALTVSIIQIIGVYFSFSLAKAIRAAKTERVRRQHEIRRQLQNSYFLLNSSTQEKPGVQYVNAAETST